MTGPRVATAGVLAAWCLLAVGDSAAEGQYSALAVTCVLLGFVALAAVVSSGSRVVVPGPRLMIVPVLVSLVAVVHHPANRYIAMPVTDVHAAQALIIMATVIAAATLWARDAPAHLAVIGVAALVGLAGVLTVVREPHPGIDVWVLLQQSSTGSAHGDDLYRQHWTGSPGLQAVYPYLPITTVLLAPFRWLLGDVRYGLIAASLVAVWFARRSAPTAPPALAGLLLIAPHWLFLTDQSWTEPLLLAALGGSFLAIRRDRPWLAVVGLAVALACKQHVVVVLPLFALWPGFGLRRTITAAALAGAAVLPWFIAGPGDMWHDTVHANLSLGVRERALNLASLLARHGIGVGFWLLLAALAAAYLLSVWRLPRTPAGLALGCALVLWAADLGNKQTYFNHYWLPLGLLVIALAAAGPTGADRPAAAPARPGPSRPEPAAASAPRGSRPRR